MWKNNNEKQSTVEKTLARAREIQIKGKSKLRLRSATIYQHSKEMGRWVLATTSNRCFLQAVKTFWIFHLKEKDHLKVPHKSN